MLTSAQCVLASLLVCLGGAGLTWGLARYRTLAGWVAFAAIAASSGLALYAAGWTLVHGPAPVENFLTVPALGFALKIHVDGLTAWFIGLIASIALPATFFSIPYLRHYPEYGVGRYYPNLLLFVAAMYGLVSTTDMMWFFFIFWQMMTLPGYALIRFEHRNPANRRAANKYLWMMQLACVLTMAGAEILAVSSARLAPGEFKYDFDSVSAHVPTLLANSPGLVALALGLFLAGFGIKLGMWPFGQVWLPDAHPAAPSPVSALLSGVMIKTGVYGLMRYFLWLVPAEAQGSYPVGTWGLVIAAFGTVTLFTGTMQALKQEQTKRLLAFHSIGQAGYILLGLGTCLALLPASDWGVIALATAAFFGALFHTLNHALFKSLLFLNAGALLVATHTQDLNRLGGLMRWMPVTAVTALVASFSIAGVPLFNGFVSKWSIFSAAVQGGPWAAALPALAVIGILTSALTLASFIKFFGASFLGRTSTHVAACAAGRDTLEVGWMMRVPQMLLAGACLTLGLLPFLAVRLYEAGIAASQQGLGVLLARATGTGGGWWVGVEALDSRMQFAPLVLALTLTLTFGVALGVSRLGGAGRRVTVPWLCGYAQEAEANRYGAHHFYVELKRHFRWLGGEPHARGGKGKGP
jgi:formate hydrogenlyase subunit 3/multisubunit Na+/H+ antiporter MnhD subunit